MDGAMKLRGNKRISEECVGSHIIGFSDPSPLLNRTNSNVLLYQVVCATLVCAIVYCNFLKEDMLGGWGTKGQKPLT